MRDSVASGTDEPIALRVLLEAGLAVAEHEEMLRGRIADFIESPVRRKEAHQA
jgi:hypothetical protein